MLTPRRLAPRWLLLASLATLAGCANSSPLPVERDRGGGASDVVEDTPSDPGADPDATADTADDVPRDGSRDADLASDAGDVEDTAPDGTRDADLVEEPDADPTAFVFASDPPEAYTRLDRAGMPLVVSLGISNQNAYNQADPADDRGGDFLTELSDNFEALLVNLQDDLEGVDSCADWDAGPSDSAFLADCLAQIGPFIIPDTIGIDTAEPAGFPNGRLLSDPVVDMTLALLLLDLAEGGSASEGDCEGTPCSIDTFVGALGPVANDRAFGDDFPYLASPAYAFAEDTPAEYDPVDRAGVPGISALFVASLDAYNQASPAADVDGDFAAEIVTQLEDLHGRLRDDFNSAGFDTCATFSGDADAGVEVDVSDCLLQLEELVIPDALKLDLSASAGFPNGRRLEDTAMDLLLAATLLDIRFGSSTTVGTCGIGNCSLTTLVGANPTENDRTFGLDFPFLAPAH